MKKIVSIISIILLTIFIVSCKNSNVSNSSKKEDETISNADSISSTTEIKKSEKLNVTVPDGWTKNEDSVLEYHYMKNTASFMVKTENFNKDKLDDVIIEAENMFSTSFENYKKISVENIKVADKDAKKLIFTCDIGNISMKYMYVYLFINNDIYAITFGDMQNTYDSLSADYDTILNSITIS